MAWGQISFILGVFGSFLTLYATTAHNAIKLDKMSIWIIKNLAVADVCNCFLVIFPILLNQYGKIYGVIIYGGAFNSIMACCRYLFFVANLFLVNILSLNKMLRCLFPLRNLVPTRRQRKMLTLATILVSFVPTFYLIYGLQVGFECIRPMWQVKNYLGAAHVGSMKLDTSSLSTLNLVINRIILTIFNALPCLTLVIFNASLVTYAILKANFTVNKMNILIVILVTTGFLISILPHFINIVLKGISDEITELTWSITYLSVWINPVIYLAVNPSFRRYTIEKLSLLRRKRVCPLGTTQPRQSLNTQESSVVETQN